MTNFLTNTYCLSKLILSSELQLCHVLCEYLEYFHHEGIHQGIDRIIDPRDQGHKGDIICIGDIHFDRRTAGRGLQNQSSRTLNPGRINYLRKSEERGTDSADHLAQILEQYPELAELATIWPSLSVEL